MPASIFRPTTLPRWNDLQEGNAAYNVAPPGGLQDTGWAVGVKPGAQHLNWLLNKMYHWLNWSYGQAFKTRILHPVADASQKQSAGPGAQIAWADPLTANTTPYLLNTTAGAQVCQDVHYNVTPVFAGPTGSASGAGEILRRIDVMIKQSVSSAGATVAKLVSVGATPDAVFNLVASAASVAGTGWQTLTISGGSYTQGFDYYLVISDNTAGTYVGSRYIGRITYDTEAL